MHILVIGKNSYIGGRIKTHLESCGHTATEVDAISDEWKTADYAGADAVELISAIRQTAGKSTHPSKFLGLGVRAFHKLSLVNKIYGGICYDMAESHCFDGRYRIVSFADGIQKTYCAE